MHDVHEHVAPAVDVWEKERARHLRAIRHRRHARQSLIDRVVEPVVVHFVVCSILRCTIFLSVAPKTKSDQFRKLLVLESNLDTVQ